MEKDCGVWNTRMTNGETQDLFKNLLSGREFQHPHLGHARIGDYDYFVESINDAVFEITFEHVIGKVYATLEELLSDEMCMQAYGAQRVEIKRICTPYIACMSELNKICEHWDILKDDMKQPNTSFLCRELNEWYEDLCMEVEELEELEELQPAKTPLSSKNKKKDNVSKRRKKMPKPSLRLVSSRSSSDDAIVVESQCQSARTTKLTSVP